MNQEQEAQQAQTVADTDDEMHGWLFSETIVVPLIDTYGCPHPLRRATMLEQYLYERCRRAESIVDSQAQKIAELKADKNGLEVAFAIEVADSEKLRQKIAEQAKEIERLKAQNGVSADDVRWVVNSIGELGVEIFGKGYFLYKGYSYMPDNPWRGVFKREFGECCISPLYESRDPAFVLGFPAAPEQTTDSKEVKREEEN